MATEAEVMHKMVEDLRVRLVQVMEQIEARVVDIAAFPASLLTPAQLTLRAGLTEALKSYHAQLRHQAANPPPGSWGVQSAPVVAGVFVQAIADLSRQWGILDALLFQIRHAQ